MKDEDRSHIDNLEETIHAQDKVIQYLKHDKILLLKFFVEYCRFSGFIQKEDEKEITIYSPPLCPEGPITIQNPYWSGFHADDHLEMPINNIAATTINSITTLLNSCVYVK